MLDFRMFRPMYAYLDCWIASAVTEMLILQEQWTAELTGEHWPNAAGRAQFRVWGWLPRGEWTTRCRRQ